MKQCPDLFSSSPIPGVDLFSVPTGYRPFDTSRTSRLPIGKQVEQDVLSYFEREPRYEVLSYGLQIQKEKITIGELDYIIRDKEAGEVFHLELVHKFYIYDPAEGKTHTDRLVGPARKDRLQYKLKKLSDHQFPLLYHPLTRPHLDALEVDASSMSQRLCFRAEVFTHSPAISMIGECLNPESVIGTYHTFSDFEKEMPSGQTEFYLATKHEWIRNMSRCNDWTDHASVVKQLQRLEEDGRPSMIWTKKGDETQRRFILFE